MIRATYVAQHWRDPLLVIAALVVPVALYVINPSWFYTAPGWVDAFATVGIGLNYADPTFANDYYKISRLPWNLLEFAARHSLAENTAQVTLQFSLIVVSILLVARIGRTLFQPPAQFVMMLLVAAFPLVNAAPAKGGADYQSAMAFPLFLAVVAAMSEFGRARTRVPAFGAGAALAALLSVNSLYLQMLPCLALFAIAMFAERGGSLSDVLHVAFRMVIGGATTVVALMLIHAAFGRGLWFFLPEWEFVLSMIRNPEQDVWWVPLRGDAVRNSPHLGFLFAVGVIAAIECVSVVVSRERSRHYVPLALHAGFLIELTIWTVWQVLGRHTTLLPSYFAHPLYGPACLSIGAMVDRHVQVRDRRLGWLAVVCMPIVTIFAISHAGRLDLSQALLSSPFTVTAFAFGLFYVALVAGSSWGAGDRIVAGARLLPAAVLLPVAMASSAPAVLYARSECRLYPEFNRFIIDGSRDLTRLVEHSTDVYVWAAPDDVVPVPTSCRRLWAGQVSDVVSSFAALGHRYVYQSSSGLTAAADLPLPVLRRIGARPNVLIAVVAADETAPSGLRERFLSAGITLTETARRTSPPDVPLPIIFVFRPTVGPMPAGVRDLDSSR